MEEATLGYSGSFLSEATPNISLELTASFADNPWQAWSKDVNRLNRRGNSASR
jgi:hypothetical protein